MADTNWQDFPDVASLLDTDIFLALRGAGGINFTGVTLADFASRNAAQGSAGSPGHTFYGDADTGMFRAAANTLGFSAGGVERARLDGSAFRLQLPTTNGEYVLSFDCGPNGLNVRDSQIRGGNNGSNQTYIDLYTADSATPTRKARIDHLGNTMLGTTNSKTRLNVAGAAGVAGPPSPGVTSGNVFISNADNGYGLLIGSSTLGPQWLQAQRTDGSAAAYELWLNPSTGNVAIGHNVTAGPLDLKTSAGRILFTNEGSANAIHSINAVNSAYINQVLNGVQLFLRSGNVDRVVVDGSGHTRPGADNTYNLGLSSFRWAQIYAAIGTINTSDERAKQDIEAVPDEWLDAWGEVEWLRYKFRDAVEEKGTAARWHIGLVAQRVRDIFAARGLDAMEIGLLCYDEWEEQREPVFVEGVVGTKVIPAGTEDVKVGTREIILGYEETGLIDPEGRKIVRPVIGEEDVFETRSLTAEIDDIGMVDSGETRVTVEAGDRWGLRYDECQAMEAAWQRREMARKDAMIAQLADRLAVLEAA